MKVKRGEFLSVYLIDNQSKVINECVSDFTNALKVTAGILVQTHYGKPKNSLEKCVVLGVFSKERELCDRYSIEYEKILDSDGFAVKLFGNNVYVLADREQGIYYGLHHLLGENVPVIFARGAKEYQMDFVETDEIFFTKTDFVLKPAFEKRIVNMCGIGSEGVDHIDHLTARYYAINKMNATMHAYSKEWDKYPLYCAGLSDSCTRIDDLIELKPEYFMTDKDGIAKRGKHESYVNFYNKDAAKEIASRMAKKASQLGENIKMQFVMPDDPYFYVKHNGIELTALPYTAENGVTVYPSQKNYKSTVYFDFLNAVVREYNRLRPNSELYTLAYMYAEPVPEVEIDPRLVVELAPINTNEKYPYTATGQTGNQAIVENIERWAKKCQNLCVYTYWFSFNGSIYSRPILQTLQENLNWFKSLGIKGVLLETKLDCSYSQSLSLEQENTRKWFDMNEAYLWVANSLVFNPTQDAKQLLKRFCKIVYKECAKELYEYFITVKKGYDSCDAYIWYATGGDIYIRRCVILSGIKDKLLSLLNIAVQKSVTPSVRNRVISIRDTVKAEIEKYLTYQEEDFEITYCSAGENTILSPQEINFNENKFSVWNNAKPVVSLRNYDTYEFYDKSAKFECRALYDKTNLYIAYTVFDDQIVKSQVGVDGQVVAYRENGKELSSYAETYIGGNAYNQSEYFGLISGFRGKDGILQLYKNSSAPVLQPTPSGVRDVKFVHLSSDLEKRYYTHVQVLPIEVLGVKPEDFKPYGSFVYYTDRFKRAGWKGNGLWSKNNFSIYKLTEKKEK